MRRVAVIVLSVAGALLLAIVLYVAFADLGRHKGQVEAFLTKQLGRSFAIDGAFELDVLPSVSILAERIRIGNAEWGTTPQMLEVGRFSTNVGLWSLISGPVDVRSFELADVSVVLERNLEGANNWTLSDEGKSEEETSLDSGVTEFPVVVQHAKLSKVQITYREPGATDRVALLESLTIKPGTDGLLAISGSGKLDAYRTKVDGHLGPIDSLFSGRNIRVKMQAAIERLQLDINGGLGRLDPLDGADLVLKLEHPDLGGMLENLRLPVVATGTLDVDMRLKDTGDLNQLDLNAKFGDIAAKLNGTLQTLGLPGSDLTFEASVADAARVAQVFDVADVPAESLTASGHLESSSEEIRFDALTANLAGAQVRADGSIRLTRDRDAAIRFELSAENLMRLRKGLPDIPLTLSGNFVESRESFELREFKSRIGKTEVSGSASMTRNDKGRIDADIASPHLDLTPFMKKETDSGARTQSAGAAKGRYVFSEEQISFGELTRTDAKLHFVFNEVKLDERMLKDVDGTLTVGAGQLKFEGRARGGNGGTLDSVFILKPTNDRAANVELKLMVKEMRAGLGSGEGIDPSQVPPTSVEAQLRTSGGSARQMASSANGLVLLTQGPGRVKSGSVDALGGGIFGQLASKLNPFSAQDPFTQLDCTVTRVDITDGKATVEPVLVQLEKVTITATGNVDLHTEDLTVDFNTSPREGIGVSPGMFTNPFIKLEGTLASPRIAIGGKGVASGAVAAATGGVSIVAKGLVDRARGEADLCRESLVQAMNPAAPTGNQAKADARH